jgi:hypothetical protein
LAWCKDRDRNGSDDGARDCRHVCQAYDKPNAPPRVTDTKTGDGAYCSLFAFLAGCVTDAGAAATGTGQRRPGLTEDLVWLCSLVDVAAGRLVASGSFF